MTRLSTSRAPDVGADDGVRGPLPHDAPGDPREGRGRHVAHAALVVQGQAPVEDDPRVT